MSGDPAAAIITGAASGIGKATVEQFQNDNAYDLVACLDVDERVTDLYATGDDVVPYVVDVSDHDAVADAVADVEKVADVNALVNNAGISRHFALADLDPDEWDRVLDVNLKGQYNCARAVCPRMVERGHGYVVNVSSGAGKQGSVSAGVHYSASKAGIFGFTKGLAKELAPAVSVNCVVPGLVDTPLATDTELWTEEELAEYADRIPFERLGRPEEVARVINFLCGDGASYMTGSVVDVDGGAALA